MAMHFSEEDKEKFEKENPEIYKKRTAETEKEEIENLSRSGKLRYFFDYYFKGILAVFIVVCILVVLFIKNLSREPSDALYVVIRHDIIMDDKIEAFASALEDYLKIDKRIEKVTVELCTSDQKLQAYIYNQVADVVIMDEENFERWGNADYFYTAEEHKTVAFYKDYEEKYRYRTEHITVDDKVKRTEDGKVKPKDTVKYNCALYLTDSEKYKQISIGIKNPVIAINKVTKHKKNAVKFVKYMMNNEEKMQLEQQGTEKE